jgi:rod shape-determining protein MreD
MARRAKVWPVWVLFLASVALEILPLPELLQPYRPPWPTIAVIYWTMMWPRQIGLLAPWCLGLVLDVLHGSLLGQNALALSVVAYLTLRFHLQIRIFPMWQITVAVLGLLSVDAFVQFWIDGVAGAPPAGIDRWLRVISGAVFWPILMALMDRMRLGIENRKSTFN